MTVHELARSLHRLSVGGRFNGEHFSVARLESHIADLFRCNRNGWIAMEIELPDGAWLFSIWEACPGCYLYRIPDTREQEARIWEDLLERQKRTS